MSESAESTDDGEAWVVDTGVFVACGREGSQKFEALRRFAVSRELVFVIPQRVYEAFGGDADRDTEASDDEAEKQTETTQSDSGNTRDTNRARYPRCGEARTSRRASACRRSR